MCLGTGQGPTPNSAQVPPGPRSQLHTDRRYLMGYPAEFSTEYATCTRNSLALARRVTTYGTDTLGVKIN
eukprot:scaffold387201_cov23-Prasinocladus_malaysianus.AAC.1